MIANDGASLGWTDWSFEPTVVCGLAALAVGYLLAWQRGWLGRSDDVSPWFPRRDLEWRPWLFAAAILSAFLALQSPLDTGGDRYLLSLHMVQHLVLMMVSPPLALLGIAGMAARPIGLPPLLRRAWNWAARPWPATVAFNVVLCVWHLPFLYDATLTTPPIHILEHLSFVVVGILFWWPIVDPLRGAATRPVGPFTKIAMLVLAGVPPTILGFVLAMGRPFYDFYVSAPRLWGVSASADQQWAGVIMLGLGNLIYFAAISVVFLRLFGDPAADEEEATALSGLSEAGGSSGRLVGRTP